MSFSDRGGKRMARGGQNRQQEKQRQYDVVPYALCSSSLRIYFSQLRAAQREPTAEPMAVCRLVRTMWALWHIVARWHSAPCNDLTPKQKMTFAKDGRANPPNVKWHVAHRLASRLALVVSPVGACFLLLVLCSFLFFYLLADRDLWSSHEGRAAQDAQTILQTGHWGLPRLFDGRAELQKPPLYYWCVAALAGLRGGQVDAWAVRLPAALSGLICVLLLFWMGLARGRPVMGLAAAMMLATAQHFTWLARTGRIDLPLALVVTVALLCFYRGQRCRAEDEGRGCWRWFLAAYLAVAVAAMLKGPIGIVLPGVVAAGFLLVEEASGFNGWTHALRRLRARGVLRMCLQGALRLVHEFGLWWGVPLIGLVAIPWYVWADQQTNGGILHSFFLYHNLDRAFGGLGGLRAYSWWFYAPRVAVDLAPWSVVLVAAVVSLRRTRWGQDPELRFGLVWFAGMLAVLSCVRFKRADYLLPAYPGAVLFMGAVAEGWYRSSRRRARLLVGFATILVGCVAGWWIFLERVLPGYEPARDQRLFASEIRRWAPAARPVLFFRTEAHALAFHVGGHVPTFVEWETLDRWTRESSPAYVVMPVHEAAEWPAHLTAGSLERLVGNEELTGQPHEHPLVLMRTHAKEGVGKATSGTVAVDARSGP